MSSSTGLSYKHNAVWRLICHSFSTLKNGKIYSYLFALNVFYLLSLFRNKLINKSKNPPSKKVDLNCTYRVLHRNTNGKMEEKEGWMDDLVTSSTLPPFQIKKNITTIKDGGFQMNTK